MSDQNTNDKAGATQQDDVNKLARMIEEGVTAWLEEEYPSVSEELTLINAKLDAFHQRQAEELAKLPEDLRAMLNPGRVGATAAAYRKAFGYAIKAQRE